MGEQNNCKKFSEQKPLVDVCFFKLKNKTKQTSDFFCFGKGLLMYVFFSLLRKKKIEVPTFFSASVCLTPFEKKLGFWSSEKKTYFEITSSSGCWPTIMLTTFKLGFGLRQVNNVHRIKVIQNKRRESGLFKWVH